MDSQGNNIQEEVKTLDEQIADGEILYQQVYPIGQPSGCSFGGGYTFGVT